MWNPESVEKPAGAADNAPMSSEWSPSGYLEHAGFVPELGASILERLHPAAGERILDVGCGEGSLTAQILASGAHVVGVDASSAMVAAARARGVDARHMDGAALTFVEEFDAVFSNAALHWMPAADAVLAGVHRALKPGGRFVAECGGHTNVAAISVALRSVLERRGVTYRWPWYFPSPDAYRARLVAHRFAVDAVTLVPRPTPLPTDMAGWLQTFAGSLFERDVPAAVRADIEQEVVALLRPSLCDEAGRWTADYVRLQVVARRLA